MALPAWSPAITHAPAAVAVTTLPLTAHGPETTAYATPRADVAVADSVAEPPFQTKEPIAGKWMLCGAFVAVTVCVTCGAAA